MRRSGWEFMFHYGASNRLLWYNRWTLANILYISNSICLSYFGPRDQVINILLILKKRDPFQLQKGEKTKKIQFITWSEFCPIVNKRKTFIWEIWNHNFSFFELCLVLNVNDFWGKFGLKLSVLFLSKLYFCHIHSQTFIRQLLLKLELSSTPSLVISGISSSLEKKTCLQCWRWHRL